MDPMDYTMDDGHQPQHPNSSQCTDYQRHQSSSSNNFHPQAQNAHHYDPVYNTDSWFQPSRPQFTTPQNISQWGPGPHVPISSWQGFGGETYGIRSDNGYRPAEPSFGGMPNSNPWSEQYRGQEPLPFGYDHYMNPHNGAPIGNTGSSRGSINTTSAVAASQATRLENTRRSRTSLNTPGVTNDSPANSEFGSTTRASREDMRLAQAQHMSRSYDYVSTPAAHEILNSRRRMPQRYDASEDDDEDSPESNENLRVHGQRLYTEADDERTLAGMRSALAAQGKKVPSKEAMASIEKVEIKDLAENERSCIICYNDFGVENPEGLVEYPMRLPKCKHVFGDKCIKKWFEDSDTCPYCRDKLPSDRAASRGYAYETMQARYRERAAMFSGSSHATAQSQRARHAFPSRFPTSDEIARESLYTRPPSEDYYIRSTQQHDSWSFSPPSSRPSQRDTPERRRQQARGRASSGRPTSVGSARFPFQSSNHHAAAELARMRVMEARDAVAVAAHRPSTPGLARQNSDHSTAANQSPTDSSSSEETSPAVAVGSGVATTDRMSSSIETRHSALTQAFWQDSFGPVSNLGDRNFYPRPNDFPRAISFDSRAGLTPPNIQYSVAELTSAQSADLGHGGPFGYRHPR